ncbi:MAG: BatA domain-containing protein [Pirellulaceae bacterium]|nr:BatA domain-containing protein [Planctomycetales bacterium]
MTFLQPLLLAGLPLIGLPILIHLINRQRHRTIPWAAMMFLLDAKRMTKGMARIRFWLIMTMRMLAIAALLLGVARPLASGWVGLTMGGQAETTLILLDRSASMEQQELQSGLSKRATAVSKIAELIKTLGEDTRIVLIENTTVQPILLESSATLSKLAETGPTDTSADIPAMFQAALDYVADNQVGRTDVWVCSDLRASDWKPDDGRWSAIRAGFEKAEGLRFNLLCYPELPQDNVSVWVDEVHRIVSGSSAELQLDITLERSGTAATPLRVPLEIFVNGTRSVVNVEMTDSQFALQGHTIPLDSLNAEGSGHVEVPTDSGAADNSFFFAFAIPPDQHTIIVSDESRVVEPVRIAVTSGSDPSLSYTAEVVAPSALQTVDWSQACLLVWQAPLPSGAAAESLQRYATSGRPVIFFPPAQPNDQTLYGIHWGTWQELGTTPTGVSNWRDDSDLLADSRSGTKLPLGKLRVQRYCTLEGDGIQLARLDDGRPLLLRSAANAENVYFCATLPGEEYSTLAQDGVTFYVMLQRAIAEGAAVLGSAKQAEAGAVAAAEVVDWTPSTDAPQDVLSIQRPYRAGAYEKDARRIAINRPHSEDATTTLDDTALQQIFQGLTYLRVDDRVGDTSSLANEIWRAFLVTMAVALLAEAWLCVGWK